MFKSDRTKCQWKITAVWLAILGAVVVLSQRAETAAKEPISLYVNVEEDGKLVQGLTEQNFRLSEEGQSRSFQLAAPETPASVALLVDNSQDAWWLYSEDIRNAIEGFVNSAPEGNWYALATFSHGLTVQVDFTREKGKISAALSELSRPLWNEVDTYDAVYEMLDKMERLPGRRALILVGSGFDSFSRHTLNDVQKKIESANVLVYGVGIGSQLRGYYEPYLGSSARMSLLQAEAFMNMLADKSGGQAWFPRFETAFVDVMRGIIQMLENQYRLVYTSQIPSDGKFHRIKVEAFQVVGDKRHDYKVRVRQGWRF